MSDNRQRKIPANPELAAIPVDKRLCSAEFHLSIMQTPGTTNYTQFKGMTLEEFVDFAAELGMEIWYGALGPESGKDSAFLHSTYLDFKSGVNYGNQGIPPADFSHRCVERAHLHGITMVSGFKMNAWPTLAKLHPEWLIQDIPDGRAIKKNEVFLCHNTEFGKWLADYLADLVYRFNLDGVWFDDTQYGSRGAWPWPAGCICKSCADKYRKDTGSELPNEIDWNSDDFKRWVNWRYDNLREYQVYLAKRVREVKPDAIVNYNSYPRPNLPWTCANDLNPNTDGILFFIETDYIRLGPTLTAKIARARGDCEIWFMMPEQLTRVFGHEAPPYLDPVFSALLSLAAFSHGVRTQSAVDYLHPEGGQMKFTYDELKKRRSYFGGKDMKQCALHLSRQTRDFRYAADPPKGAKEMQDLREKIAANMHIDTLYITDVFNHFMGTMLQHSLGDTYYWRQFIGIAEMLEQKHIIYNMIFDKSITPSGLDGYHTLVLPNSACLSNEQCQSITDWVKNGGTLIANYESSLYDELGHKRENFGLSEVLGINYIGTYDKDGKSGTIYVPQGEYREKYGLWQALNGQHTEFRPVPGEALSVLFTLSIRKTLGSIPVGDYSHDSGHPGIVEHKYGNGRAVYISADIGSAFSDHPVQRTRELFSDIVQRGGLQIEVLSPSRILSHAMYGDNGNLNVHLYHRFAQLQPWDAGHWDGQQWSALDEPFPVHGIKLKVNGGVKTARMPLRNIDLEIENGDTVLVP